MIRIRQLKLSVLEPEEKLISKIKKVLSIEESDIFSWQIRKKSIDARKKDQLCYVYEIDVEVKNEYEILKKKSSKDIFSSPKETYQFPLSGKIPLPGRPIIVGTGPAGLFCAYFLAENGYFPIVIEQGEPIERRVKTVEEFFQTGKLNFQSNVQFGEGGAGTFSDGKLNTMIKDKHYRGKKVLELFVENGAPKEILYESKPHIGTDRLREVIKKIREKIIANGGEFRYLTKLTNIRIHDGKITDIEINHQEWIPCSLLVLAIGHSSRDTIEMLEKNNLKIVPKPFAVGIRIEHKQEMINQAQYGKYASYLPPASYKLTYTTKEKRGVYSFCMCPGGYVINASSEPNMLAINGMSNYQRETENANSALVVTVSPKDFGTDPLDGIRFQRNLEKKAYEKGQGKIPIQRYQDFKENKVTTRLGQIKPVTKGDYTFANLNEIFPKEITHALKEAIEVFDHQIKGYALNDAILLGVESRTSSPVRIERDEEGVANIKGIYPCGEGAGYAGGITSSAIDGIKVAEWIAKKYKNKEDEEERIK